MRIFLIEPFRHRISILFARPKMSIFSEKLRDFSRKLRDAVDRRLLTDSEFRSWLIFLREFFPNIICLVPLIGEVKQFSIDVNKKVGNPPDCSYTLESFQSDIPKFLCNHGNDKPGYFLKKSDLGTVLNHFKSEGVTDDNMHNIFFLFRRLPFHSPTVEFAHEKLRFFKELVAKFEGKGEEDVVVIDWWSIEGMILLSNFEEMFRFTTKITKTQVLVVPAQREGMNGSYESARAFKAEYKNLKILEDFKKHIDACFAAWHWTKYYSAYTTVVNSSMVGKSRMICQLPELGVFLFLVCLRKEDDPTSPPRTPKVAYAFLKMDWMTEFEAQLFVFQYMIACISALNEWLENLPVDIKKPPTKIELAKMWFNYQKTGLPQETRERTSFMDYAESFWSKILEKIQPTPLPKGVDPPKNLLNALKRDASSKLENNLTELVRILRTKYEIALSPQEVSVVYAFDEARRLINKTKGGAKTSFDIVRRSFCIVQKNYVCPGQFGIIIDNIVDSVVDFVPPEIPWDDSRQCLLPGSKSFEPYFAIDSMDAFAEDLNQPDLQLDLKSLELGYTKYGRAAFYAMTYVENGDEKERLRLTCDLIPELAKKILADKNHVERISTEQAVAILGILVPVSIAPSHDLSSQLVSNHMRFCCGISEDRKLIYTVQLPEPALARAALKLAIKYGWDTVIDKFSDIIGSGVNDEENGAQLCMQICCIAAFAKCQNLYKYDVDEKWARITSVDMTTFMKASISEEAFKGAIKQLEKSRNRGNSQKGGKKEEGIEEVKKDDVLNQFDGMVVRICQFVEFHSDVDQSVLLEYFKRGCGIVSRRICQNCDIIIPVFCSSDPDSKLVPENMSCMTIQVKALKDRESHGNFLSNAYHGMRPSHCGIKGLPKDKLYISLYVDFGGFEKPPRSEASRVSSHHEVDNHIAFSYLSYSARAIFEEPKELGNRIFNSMKLLMEPVLPENNTDISAESRRIVGKIMKITSNWNEN
jgi:hypothetical protein